jgi:hypothetical protein
LPEPRRNSGDVTALKSRNRQMENDLNVNAHAGSFLICVIHYIEISSPVIGLRRVWPLGRSGAADFSLWQPAPPLR